MASFRVADQLSINLRLRSRGVFPVIYGTHALIMNVCEALVLDNYSRRDLLYSLHGKDLDYNFILMR